MQLLRDGWSAGYKVGSHLYFFYSSQGETLYYNGAQHFLLGDELCVIAFGDNQDKSQSHVYFFLRHSANLCMLATTLHVCDHQISGVVRTQ